MSDPRTGQLSLTQPSPPGELAGAGDISERQGTKLNLIATWRQKRSNLLEILSEKCVGSWRSRGYYDKGLELDRQGPLRMRGGRMVLRTTRSTRVDCAAGQRKCKALNESLFTQR
ncbi:hypothetical protein CTAM01_06823 [Colletotrichum tamarilloi]|uniref:Uncharacterized protein n=1 Tax=Colletotrichum tamarilloi TaxID=1209934 RepID=A0ABQ9RAX1_9PEZI|nr:uncharacterized protein CTAM01_06823 [Colletotrichum tamarilloi]KAK1499629.1 hypothetical protein CTAM01_06823 [Colletotrichum tamarilloi]